VPDFDLRLVSADMAFNRDAGTMTVAIKARDGGRVLDAKTFPKRARR